MTDQYKPSRRETLKLGGSTIVAGSMAGCSFLSGDGPSDGSGGSSGGDGDGSGASTGGSNSQEAPEGPIQIGHMTFLEGPAAAIGAHFEAAIDYGVQLINDAGGLAGRQIEVEHTHESGQEVETFERYVSEDKDVIFGPTGSGGALSTAEIAEEQEIVMLTPARSVELLEETVPDPEYVFAPGDSTITQGPAAAFDVIERMGGELTVAGINPNYAYGRTLMQNFIQTLRNLGTDIELVYEGYPEFLGGDFSTQISEINSNEPDVTFSSVWADDAIALMSQAHGQDMFENTTLFTTSITPMTPQIDDEIIEAADIFNYGGNYHWNHPPSNQWPPHENFNQGISEYIDNPVFDTMIGFEMLVFWANAVEKAANLVGGWPTQQQIATALEGSSIFSPGGYSTIQNHAGYRPNYWGQLVSSDRPLVAMEDINTYSPKEMTPPPGMTSSEWIESL